MHRPLFIPITAALALSAGAAAHAQTSANVREVVRVVKAGRAGSTELFTAKVGTPLSAGDRVRTGGRSGAGLRFNDQSLLRLGELTEVVVTSPNQRAAQVLRGKVFADFKSPGTITGGYAVAAVRGTHVTFDEDGASKETRVRCYRGNVFVAARTNPVSAGFATNVTPTGLADAALTGSPVEWRGGDVRFTSGPYAGVAREITAFDPASGAVTFNPPLPEPKGTGRTEYLLVKDRNRAVVQLLDNMGTTVPENGEPGAAHRVPNEEFADLARSPFFAEMRDGQTVSVYNGGAGHQETQDETFTEVESIKRVNRQERQKKNPLDCDIFGNPKNTKQAAGIRSAVARSFAEDTPVRMAGRDTGGGLPADQRVQPAMVRERSTGEFGRFRFEPFAFASNRSEAIGGRVRYQATQGDVYAEVGYRYQLLDGRSDHDISEGFLHLKGHKGDIIAGRQHLFLQVANNTRIGTLLGLDASDAVIIKPKTGGSTELWAGYVFDTDSLQRGGMDGGIIRGKTGFLRGNAGFSVFAENQAGRNLGWSVDTVQPIMANIVDFYGEAGSNTAGRQIYTAGLYLPFLYQQAKVDVFLEYAHREDLLDLYTLRVRRELGNNLLLVGFLERRSGDSTINGGGGIVWSIKLR